LQGFFVARTATFKVRQNAPKCGILRFSLQEPLQEKSG